MQITKELLDTELASMQARHAQAELVVEQAKASANKIAGAITVLEDLRKYMDREEPVQAPAVPRTDISEENAAIQERDTNRALSMQEVAEWIAGPGATAEEPEPLDVQPRYDFPVEHYEAEEEGLDANR